MLILRRKVGESFLVGDRINITILEMESNGTVSIGIDAPRDVLILRSELQQAVSANQESAKTTSTPQMMKALEMVFSGNLTDPETDPRKEDQSGVSHKEPGKEN